MSKTLCFKITTGVNKGYFHNNDKRNSLDLVCSIWQSIAGNEYNESGIYITAAAVEGKVIYNELWGCPKGGEDIVILSGMMNKEFVKDKKLWKETVLKLTKILKDELKQNTITCEFNDVDFYYFK
ncbi:hypothetical protein [Abyssisolibacter fermentans]|uniref:hypothetical protein n=1 Tax=Abyssisolibacter fermentans TaxID=1766203 RepID=UPI0008345EC7|nr:hypothetical protein [Abyssisolibacter fermentans]